MSASVPGAAPLPPPAGRRSNKLVIAGFVCCAATLILPPLGFVAIAIGIVLIVRSQVGPGVAILLLGLILPLFGVVIFQAIVAKPYRIPSASMEPTLEIGDRILVDKTGRGVGRGDLVVVKPPSGADASECGVPGFEAAQRRQACPRPTPGASASSFVERIVAVGGDRLRVERGRVILNGRPAEEPGIRPSDDCEICNLPKEIEIPPDHVFLMGDNRGESADSRLWGPVREDQVIGRVVFRYWPVERLGSP